MYIDGQKIKVFERELGEGWDIDFEAWDIDCSRALMRHTPSGMNFEIVREGPGDTVEAFCGRLVHIDDGQPVLEHERVASLSKTAIILFAADLGYLKFDFREREAPPQTGQRKSGLN